MGPPSEKEDSRRLKELLYKIDELIIQLTRRLYIQVARQAPNELTQSQFVLCRLLKKHGRMTVSELAESLGVSLSAVTVTADKLCRSGIMRRERSEQDRRVVWLALTEDGYRVVSDALESWNLALKGYFARLPEEDLERLNSICGKLLAKEQADRAKTALKESVPADAEKPEAKKEKPEAADAEKPEATDAEKPEAKKEG
ncbi:MAG: MarR family transcriptional regulator [Bacillota bacterium]